MSIKAILYEQTNTTAEKLLFKNVTILPQKFYKAKNLNDKGKTIYLKG